MRKITLAATLATTALLCPLMASGAQARLTMNGNSLNGNSLNGNSLNGNTLNGNTLNGNTLNGNTLNGNTLNGFEQQGLQTNGLVNSGNGRDIRTNLNAIEQKGSSVQGEAARRITKVMVTSIRLPSGVMVQPAR